MSELIFKEIKGFIDKCNYNNKTASYFVANDNSFFKGGSKYLWFGLEEKKIHKKYNEEYLLINESIALKNKYGYDCLYFEVNNGVLTYLSVLNDKKSPHENEVSNFIDVGIFEEKYIRKKIDEINSITDEEKINYDLVNFLRLYEEKVALKLLACFYGKVGNNRLQRIISYFLKIACDEDLFHLRNNIGYIEYLIIGGDISGEFFAI
ncbi:hypothetical protein [Pectobacterium jejuense]|uniref:hypothetical protein n=1 Tax=Pectobacterium jejuense TaxID=2974022 RepID=UPI002083D397|nr:hypothetical protein [Pectobacterium jejuense]MCY9846729.1 hypothetical protein [Pectobacterium jejuense]GKX39843.1 hypothetical protein SOASR014_35820 [Pectobacterium carotovorum subsp. carotovorum]GLX45930.1 hypothetical protein Pcaca01_35980 [Pectobacterium carotovorum subsp. carotovorum]